MGEIAIIVDTAGSPTTSAIRAARRTSRGSLDTGCVDRLARVGKRVAVHRQRHHRPGHVLRGKKGRDAGAGVQRIEQPRCPDHVLHTRWAHRPALRLEDIPGAAQVVPVQRSIAQRDLLPVPPGNSELRRTLRQRPLHQVYGQQDSTSVLLSSPACQHLDGARMGEHDTGL